MKRIYFSRVSATPSRNVFEVMNFSSAPGRMNRGHPVTGPPKSIRTSRVSSVMVTSQIPSAIFFTVPFVQETDPLVFARSV